MSVCQMLKDAKSNFESASAEEILEWAINKYGADTISLASSLSIEDQALTHMLQKINRAVSIFLIDTGRLFQETYDVVEETMQRYSLTYEILYPDAEELRRVTREYGPNLFYRGSEFRKACCRARKVIPLKSKLSQCKAWICGLRRGQAITRTSIEKIEVDRENALIKLNPIADWNEAQVWRYIRENKIPYNKLYDKNFKSIGCAPCTRPLAAGEDIRDGRWWWEEPHQRECGLHPVISERGNACLASPAQN